MAVNKQRGAGGEAGEHGGVFGVELDKDEAVPGRTVSFDFRLELAKEGLAELEDLEDPVGSDQGLGSGGGGIGEKDVFEVVGAGGQDGGALVDLGRIEEVEDGEVLDGEDLVHALNAESALAIEKIRNMSLFKTCLLGQPETG